MKESGEEPMSKKPKMETSQENEIKEAGAVVTCQGSSSAFYNPAQEFNRDLSILVARFLVSERSRETEELEKELAEEAPDAFGKGRRQRLAMDLKQPMRILEALAATGLRAIRYAQEVEGLDRITANDFSQAAVDLMRENIARNGVEEKVEAHFGDAILVMHAHKQHDKRFHLVDLDPYGSPSQFLDSAVQAVSDGGVLAVTCTDVAVLCGNAPETCFAKYGSLPIRSKACHEAALRIVLRTIESHANRYSRIIEPLLSVSVDFYIRIFVRLRTGQIRCKDSVTKLGHLMRCVGCGTQRWQPLAKKTELGKAIKYSASQLESESGVCSECGGRFVLSGPFWTHPIHDGDWVTRFLAFVKGLPEERRPTTHSRIVGMLSLIQEELADVPLFYDYAEMCHHARISVPKLNTFRSAILNAGKKCNEERNVAKKRGDGYRVSVSHTDACAIKSDAPNAFLWDVVRTLASQQGVSASSQSEESLSFRILSKESEASVDLTFHPDADSVARKEGLLRFQDNRGKGHGPKNKAKGSVHSVQAGAYSELNNRAKEEVKTEVKEESL